MTSTSKRMRRTLTAAVVGLFALLAVPGTAFAYTDPDRAVSTAVPVAGTATYEAPAAQASPSGWSMSTPVVVIAIAVLLVGILVLALRITRLRRGTVRTTRAVAR